MTGISVREEERLAVYFRLWTSDLERRDPHRLMKLFLDGDIQLVNGSGFSVTEEVHREVMKFGISLKKKNGKRPRRRR